MKKLALKIFVLCMAICAVLGIFSACSEQQEHPLLGSQEGNSLNTLRLLSFETVQEQPSGESIKLQSVSMGMQNNTELSAIKLVENKEHGIEEIDNSVVEVVATVKNENRDSFVDLVLYVSYLNTKVVFNEGNGEYVCASTTKLEDGIWVTKITLTLNLIFDEEYTCNIEIDEINFLHGGTDVWKTDLNNNGVKRKDFGFVGDFDVEYGENGEFRQDKIIYEIMEGNEVKIVGNTINADIDLEIPSEVTIGKNYKNKNGTVYSVTEIADEAFCDCKFIKNLTVPAEVLYIGYNAFRNCGEFNATISSSTVINRNAFENTLVIYPTKSQLYIYNQRDGIGLEWLNILKEKFEILYADYSFEEGKKGVQIIVEHNYDDFDKNNVIITNNLNYKEFVAAGKLLDITDVLTGTLSTFNENNNIENKLYNEQKNFLKTDSKYFAVPHTDGCYGLTYDADLFEEYGFYYLDDGTFGHSSSGKRLAAGPDGIYGTYDDGLPATYDEFFKLCDRMIDYNVTPMISSGLYVYMAGVVNSLITDYNGYDNERIYYTLNGTTNRYVTEFNENVPILGNRIITQTNGYDIFRQAGYYYGFSFLDRLYNGRSGQYLSQDARRLSFSYIDAQNKFLYSSVENKPIAMLADGTWWQSEAQYVFESMEKEYGANYSANNRNLKFMPLPKATTSDVGTGRTLFNAIDSYMVINKNTPENVTSIAKLFIQFCNTDENLQEFTAVTNMTKALKYEIDNDTFEKLTPFGKSVVETKKNAKMIYPCSDNAFYQENAAVLNRNNIFKNNGNNSLVSAVQVSGFNVKEYFINFANSWEKIYQCIPA